MRIVSLMDNIACGTPYVAAHGLSFYIEANGRKLLFDMGPDGGFAQNAASLGIDLSKVELAVLSHGHYDHGGGLDTFFRINGQAPVHMRREALEKYYAHDPGRIRYIGLSREGWEVDRIVYHKEAAEILPGVLLFGDVTGRELASAANDSLYQELAGEQVPDRFAHEQNLLLTEGDHAVLVAGCAHNGIVNILEKAKTLTEKPITHVFGGLHLKGLQQMEPFARKLGERLRQEPTVFYTCHCTSMEGYEALRMVMGEQIGYLAAGAEVAC